MKTLSLLATAAVVALTLVACGGEDDDTNDAKGGSTANETSTIACDNRSIESTCADFAAGTTRDTAKASCDGTVIETACPKANAIARCTVTTKDGVMTNTYYSDGITPHTEADAREACTGFNGTFAAP